MARPRINEPEDEEGIEYNEEEWDSILKFYRDYYLTEFEGRSPTTAGNYYKYVREFFIWFKQDAFGDEKHEIIEYKYSEPEEPEYTAEEIGNMTRRDIEDILYGDERPGLDIQACIDYEREHKNRSSVIERLESRANAEVPMDYIHLTKDEIDSLDVRDLRKFLKQKRESNDKLQKETARKYKDAMNWFMEMCGSNECLGFTEHLKFNTKKLKKEIKKFKNPNQSNGGSKIDYEDCIKLVRATKELKERAVIMTALKTSARASGLAHIRLCDVYFEEKWIHLPKRKGEGGMGKKQDCCIDEELVKILKPYYQSKINEIREIKAEEQGIPEEEVEITDADLKNNYLFSHSGLQQYRPESLSDMVRRCAKAAGLENIKGAHDLRYSFKFHYSYAIGDTQIGDDFWSEFQMSHAGIEEEDVNNNYKRAVTDIETKPCKERFEDYEIAMPNYLIM